MLAGCYKNEKYIVGFDFFNELFSGSEVKEALGGLFAGITEHLNSKGRKQYTVEEVAEMWMDDEDKNFILGSITVFL